MLNMNTISTLYVSQKNGDDGNNGFYAHNKLSSMGPLKTMERAFELLSELRFFGARQPITIKILDDEYRTQSPIIVDNKLGQITIEGNGKTLISGGVQIENFKEDIYNGTECLSSDVSFLLDEGLSFTDFYVNKKRAKFTRYPKEGTLDVKMVENSGLELWQSSKWVVVEDKDIEVISSFKNIKDCIISYNHLWIDEHTPIESFDKESGKLVFEYRSRYSISPEHSRAKIQYIIENVAECFENPGEWYLDRETKKVYYIPLDEGETAENITAYAPIAKQIFVIKGEEDNKVENIIIRDLEIAYTKGDFKSHIPSKGESLKRDKVIETESEAYSSDGQSMFSADGAIDFEFATNCFVENCKIYCIGLHSIKIGDGCSYIDICKNEITNGGGGGISASGGEYGTEEKFHTHSLNICDNLIKSCGKRHYRACGILLRHTYNNRISHNTICDLFYSGISLGWVWGQGKTINKNNIIEYNHIYKIGQKVLSDMGGIYVLGNQVGTIIRNNLIHDVSVHHYGGHAIYIDEGSSYVTIENNVCYNTQSCSCNLHYGNLNVIRNNIFAFADDYNLRLLRHIVNIGMMLENNIIVSRNKPIFMLGYGDETALVNMAVSHNNIIFDYENKEPVMFINGDGEIGFKEAQEKFDFEIDSEVIDPEFVDVENFNFEFKETSPVFRMGFKKIDMSTVGKR